MVHLYFEYLFVTQPNFNTGGGSLVGLQSRLLDLALLHQERGQPILTLIHQLSLQLINFIWNTFLFARRKELQTHPGFQRHTIIESYHFCAHWVVDTIVDTYHLTGHAVSTSVNGIQLGWWLYLGQPYRQCPSLRYVCGTHIGINLYFLQDNLWQSETVK